MVTDEEGSRDSPQAARSWIARERIRPGASPLWFGGLAFILGGVAAFVLIGLVPQGVPFRVGEVSYLRGNGLPLARLYTALGAEGARVAAALFAGLAVTATAFSARRLSHSVTVGVVAAVLVALDPLLLAEGHLALPRSFLMATALFALASFLSSRSAIHWAGTIFLAAAAMTDLTAVLWGLALGAMVLMRGHIYAAPKHLGTALLQTVAIPGVVGAIAHLAAFAGRLRPAAGCIDLPWWDVLVLRSALNHGDGVIAIHNPATWFAGLGALLFLSALALAYLGQDFRLARLPGRIQMRLTNRLPRVHGRALWVLLLLLFAPTALWLPLLAIALGLGVQELSQDAKAFGFVIHGAAIVFALAYLIRLWPLVMGSPDLDAAMELGQVMPWGRVVPCAP